MKKFFPAEHLFHREHLAVSGFLLAFLRGILAWSALVMLLRLHAGMPDILAIVREGTVPFLEFFATVCSWSFWKIYSYEACVGFALGIGTRVHAGMLLVLFVAMLLPAWRQAWIMWGPGTLLVGGFLLFAIFAHWGRVYGGDMFLSR